MSACVEVGPRSIEIRTDEEWNADLTVYRTLGALIVKVDHPRSALAIMVELTESEARALLSFLRREFG